MWDSLAGESAAGTGYVLGTVAWMVGELIAWHVGCWLYDGWRRRSGRGTR